MAHSSDLYSLLRNVPEILLSKLTTSVQNNDKDVLNKIIFERETNLSEITGRFADTRPEIVDLNQTMCGFLLPEHLKWPFLSSSVKHKMSLYPNLLFCRLSGTHPALHRETLWLVNKFNRDVVVIGASVSVDELLC
jgi:hypothetical protein